ncbi:methyltransferase domain-containing protein [Amycolatopsis sp. PS_44_ISF1]|uniref:class I SAM-dependent methyltransferase n=1 Tax=Amycolatopsis sp. PS_44_ISF1 TaxID=2974917 RepID=UPI0028E05DB0|nr:methyltransferase domain-containing protein [Amycolatopsis sp. PS_44_ISF1]MDT8915831.1 methyltransferase domain-containing protein [Amycolatopsis sp. PS_44_ISF1]
MSGHTHDHIDWADRLALLRAADALDAVAMTAVARRLVAGLPPRPTIVDLGCGAGGMSAHFARELGSLSGGVIVLVDATPALLEEAERAANSAADLHVASDGRGSVEIRAVLGDLADTGLAHAVPSADLVWASHVVHHLADQQAAVGAVAAVAKPGGLVALAEGGLDFRCLPWDLGIGRPGLENRMLAAQAEWFIGMREGIDGAVPMPYGWSTALDRAGLTEVDSFGALVHHPSPGPESLADYVVNRLGRLREFAGGHLTADDLATVDTLLDRTGPHFVGARQDLYLLGAKTIHCGRRP